MKIGVAAPNRTKIGEENGVRLLIAVSPQCLIELNVVCSEYDLLNTMIVSTPKKMIRQVILILTKNPKNI